MALFKTQSTRAVMVFQVVSITVWVFLANLLIFSRDGVVSALVMGLLTGLMSALLFALPIFRRKQTDEE